MKQRETSADLKRWLIQLFISFPCGFFLYYVPKHIFQCPDPAFQVNPDLDEQKIEKNLAKKRKLSFLIKNFNYLSLGLHKRHPSYRGSLQPSKENIQHFKK